MELLSFANFLVILDRKWQEYPAIEQIVNTQGECIQMRLFKLLYLFSIFITSFAYCEIDCPHGCGRDNAEAGSYILRCLMDLNFIQRGDDYGE